MMHINCCAGIAQCRLKLRAPITQSTELSRSISGPSSGFGAPIEGRQSDSDGVRPLSRRGPICLHLTRFEKMKKSRDRNQISSASLSIVSMPKDKRGCELADFCISLYSQFLSFVWFSWH